MKLNSLLIFGMLFLVGFNFPRVGATGMNHVWIRDKKSVEILSNDKLDSGRIVLKDEKGNRLKFRIKAQTNQKLSLETTGDLSITPFLSAEYGEQKLFSTPHYTYLNKYFHYSGDLGVKSTREGFRVTVWSPTASKVELKLFQNYSEVEEYSFEMKKGERGSWFVDIPKSNKGMSYLFKVHSKGKISMGLDPYAKVMEAANPKSVQNSGRGIIEDLGRAKPRKTFQNMANNVDYIGYEAHIRDFSITEAGGGTYQSFGSKLGHIQELGATHIQFMPLQNFYTVVETDRSFQGPDAPKNDINYNWGYDPHNYFTPEGHYSENPKDHLLRIKEVKELFDKTHKKNMGVVLDVVYNHLYSEDTLEKAAPESYMRRSEDGKVSFKSGAGASLESRNLMTRRLIIDSLKWWKDFYGVDGFRFDLMGFTDLETMRAIRQSLGSDSILYGEAWEFTDLPKDQATTKSQIPKELEISAFNDTSRDSYSGHMHGKGFIQGESHELPKVRAGLVAGYQDFPTRGGLISKDSYHLFAKSPMQALNFLTIHDGPTLWDKVNLSFKGNAQKRKKLVRQAFAMLLTSQGRIIFHGGMEFGRSKPLAENDPNPDRALTSSEVDPENGVTYFHENSYRSPDTTNAIKWERKKEFLHEFEYLKKLIELRRKTPALRYLAGENLKKGLHFLGGELNWPPAHSAGYESFKEVKLDELEIQFINASTEARNKRWYLAGEIHPKDSGGESKNPLQNPWHVDIDNHGKGTLRIKKQNLAELDLESWSDPEGLQFKLISTPGEWDTLPGSYSTMGNNTVKPLSIDRKNQVTIDLSILNHEASREEMKTKAIVAYRLDNTLEADVVGTALPYSELLVVHSGDSKTHVLRQKDLNPVDWKIILDGENIDLRGLSFSSHKLSKGKLEVAPQSSAVLVKNK